ncbi:MAG: hypothetical protein IT480_17345 [Gammaproteobacteria bacterium]|nr:hypothetical protein [Gammaproteobacteria bacterium]
MRVMLLLLVLANLMFFGWANWVDRPPARPRAMTPVPALQLAAQAGQPDAARQRCRRLGSWADEATARAAGAVLAGRGFKVAVESVEDRISDGFWVYIAAADAELQRRVLRQLARANVRDAAIVEDAAAGTRVSAGLFTERQGAEERAAAVRRAGLEPVLEERYRSRSSWWLDVQLGAQAAEPRADGAELAGAGAALQWSDCPD